MSTQTIRPFLIRRHLNKLRWLSLTAILLLLIFIPYAHIYQTFLSAHAYDLLAPGEKRLYDIMEALTALFLSNPVEILDAVKGTTWSGEFWGVKLSDPLAALSQIFAGLGFFWPFLATAFIPVVATALLGRFFCGWICPATLVYELNTNLAAWARSYGFPTGEHRFDRRIKYGVLGIGLVISALSGSVLIAAVYPPAIIGRELYYGIAQGGFGLGIVFIMMTLLFDFLVSRRGFCRYLCPGGALYSLIGRYRVLRIQRSVAACNDCMKCNAVCEFDLEPAGDKFGQECNNCTACMAICPTDALEFSLKFVDRPGQGPGHLGKEFQRRHEGEDPNVST